jgi:cadherin-related family protein 2
LIVYIKDRNDNIPQFAKQSYNIAIPENVPVGVSIAKIEAIDLDSGDFGTQGIRYTGITGKVVNNFFHFRLIDVNINEMQEVFHNCLI